MSCTVPRLLSGKCLKSGKTTNESCNRGCNRGKCLALVYCLYKLRFAGITTGFSYVIHSLKRTSSAVTRPSTMIILCICFCTYHSLACFLFRSATQI